jgi:hypothetical protein
MLASDHRKRVATTALLDRRVALPATALAIVAQVELPALLFVEEGEA